MTLQIVGGSAHRNDVVAKITECPIAVEAEYAADVPTPVPVVQMDRLPLSANGANAALSKDQPGSCCGIHAIATFQLEISTAAVVLPNVRFDDGSMARPAVGTQPIFGGPIAYEFRDAFLSPALRATLQMHKSCQGVGDR